MPDDRKPARPGYEWTLCPKCLGAKVVEDVIYHGPPKPCGWCEGRGEYEKCVDGSDWVGGA